jgi:hypothetical protein
MVRDFVSYDDNRGRISIGIILLPHRRLAQVYRLRTQTIDQRILVIRTTGCITSSHTARNEKIPGRMGHVAIDSIDPPFNSGNHAAEILQHRGGIELSFKVALNRANSTDRDWP